MWSAAGRRCGGDGRGCRQRPRRTRRPNDGSTRMQGARRFIDCRRDPIQRGLPRGRRQWGPFMNLSEVFIRRQVMTVALTVSVILFGLLAYFRLPVSDLPAVDYPVIQV